MRRYILPVVERFGEVVGEGLGTLRLLVLEASGTYVPAIVPDIHVYRRLSQEVVLIRGSACTRTLSRFKRQSCPCGKLWKSENSGDLVSSSCFELFQGTANALGIIVVARTKWGVLVRR